ncbi:MAG: ribosomal protein S18-alanine N-acetyltransferase [Armatimonadota bacterium]
MTSGSDSQTWLDGVVIEPMVPDDLEEVLAIERRAFPSAWSRASYERELRSVNTYYFVARSAGVLVGYTGMWIVYDEAHVTTIAVHPQWRRRGLATRLMSMLIALARRDGAAKLTLEVRERNQAALALYRKLAFEEKGLLPGYYGDTGENGIVMWRPLLPPASAPPDRREAP